MPDPTAPITVAITRRISSEHLVEAGAWVQAGQGLVESFPGFLGSGWMRAEPGSSQWLVVFRFADAASLGSWEASPERTDWMSRGDRFVEHVRAERLDGWFDEFFSEPHSPDTVSPPRWKQMVAIFLVFFPLSVAANYTLAAVTGVLPIWLRVLLSVVVLTPIMTYWALPFINRALRPWLTAAPTGLRRARSPGPAAAAADRAPARRSPRGRGRA